MIERELTLQEDFKKIADNLHRIGKVGMVQRGGKTFIISEEEITDQQIIDAITAGDNAKLVRAAYAEMVTDVYDQMESVFGTRNDVSASAFAATYEAMLKRPANYIDVDLGLADEAAVAAYAQAKIAASDAYGVFRLKRIAQYQAEKAAIEGA